jgi:hypothetical protein
MVQCDAYASSVTPEGRLAEPDGVWGGRRSLERHKALIKARHVVAAAPDRVFHTEQKQAVLKALAVCWDPFEVAAAAGMDVRTANWQRSSLVRLLGLPKDASRMRALAAARERGLLEGVVLVADDGSVPAIPPPTKLPAQEQEDQEPVELPPVAVLASRPRRPRRRVQRSRQSVAEVMPGQLSFFDDVPAPVQSLYTARRLEAAA